MAETEKSRDFLRFAAASERRAASYHDEGFKKLFLRIAAEYRDFALRIEDPEMWRAKQKERVGLPASKH
jgi:hypothetical protein